MYLWFSGCYTTCLSRVLVHPFIRPKLYSVSSPVAMVATESSDEKVMGELMSIFS